MSEKPKKKATKKTAKTTKKTVKPVKTVKTVEAEKVVNKAANKPFDYKTTIWVGLTLVALVLVVMAILKFNQNEKIDSSYFHDADGKVVLTMTKDNAALDESIWEAPITHVVYYHSGDTLTGARAFYEYTTEAEAEEAFKHLELGDFANNKKINGKFVVFEIKDTRYDTMSLEELKNSIERLKQSNKLVLNYDENYINTYTAKDSEE